MFKIKQYWQPFLIFAILFLCINCNNKYKLKSDYGSENPLNHSKWTALLQQNVNDKGLVNYKGFIKDSTKLNNYLKTLTGNTPTDNWSKNAQLAYWINVYNAFTVKLVIDNYPVESIKDIKRGIPFISSVWDIKFIPINDDLIDLNEVEHGILRKKFNEPRIHFAINCASISCPTLLNEAYTTEKLEAQLTKMSKAFLADKTRNIITENKLQLSKIFSWFKGDFVKEQSLIEFLNLYAPVNISNNAAIEHLPYNWHLNEVLSNN